MFRKCVWFPYSKDLILLPNEVHIWRANLNVSSSTMIKLRETLSADEKQRAERFHFERDRVHFIAARGILRSILAQYSNTSAPELKFSYSERGKPYLKESEISFNLSHSHGLALYAFTLSQNIGIDVEYLRDLESTQLAKRFFTIAEYNRLISLPIQQQQTAFFQVWTAKEAYLKATGDGLVGLQNAEFDLSLDKPISLFKIAGKPVKDWSIEQFIPETNYIATVAIEGGGNVKFWEWENQEETTNEHG